MNHKTKQKLICTKYLITLYVLLTHISKRQAFQPPAIIHTRVRCQAPHTDKVAAAAAPPAPAPPKPVQPSLMHDTLPYGYDSAHAIPSHPATPRPAPCSIQLQPFHGVEPTVSCFGVCGSRPKPMPCGTTPSNLVQLPDATRHSLFAPIRRL